eukprot:COSAG01_NODE_1762_length_9295_cov_7.745134_2_plen_2326_part_00
MRCVTVALFPLLFRSSYRFVVAVTSTNTCPTIPIAAPVDRVEYHPAGPVSSLTQTATISCSAGYHMQLPNNQGTGFGSSVTIHCVPSGPGSAASKRWEVPVTGPLNGPCVPEGTSICPDLSAVPNAQLLYSPGSSPHPLPGTISVLLTCDPGFSFMGADGVHRQSGTFVCAGGRWDPNTPTSCTPHTSSICPQLQLRQNHGTVTYMPPSPVPTASTTAATVRCSSGMQTPDGLATTTVSCALGQWNQVPTCSTVCNNLEDQVPNAGVNYFGTGTHLESDTARVSCNPGSQTSFGEQTYISTCSSGQWTPIHLCIGSGTPIGPAGPPPPAQPPCAAVTFECGAAAAYSNAPILNSATYPPQTVATIQCPSGYVIAGGGTGSTTCVNGAWFPQPQGLSTPHGLRWCVSAAQDACSSFPCGFNGRCSAAVLPPNGYTCDCTCPDAATGAMYAGDHCECLLNLDGSTPATCAGSNICDPTQNTGCLHGGSCVASAMGPTCTCTAGFCGSTCDTAPGMGTCPPYTPPPTSCAGNPCQNGGTCQDIGLLGSHSIRCACLATYQGDYCQTAVGVDTHDDCNPNPCQNGGTCTDNANSFECACTTGIGIFTGERVQYGGPTCAASSQGLDNCVPSPCHNGTCTNAFVGGVWAYTCTCATNYFGDNCDQYDPINSCVSPPPSFACCPVGGSCLDIFADQMCECNSGYTGSACDINTNTGATMTPAQCSAGTPLPPPPPPVGPATFSTVKAGFPTCTETVPAPTPAPSQNIMFGCVQYDTISCAPSNNDYRINYAGALLAFQMCSQQAPQQQTAPPGYCSGNLSSALVLRNHDVCTNPATTNIAYHISISFDLVSPGTYSFRMHGNYGASPYFGVDQQSIQPTATTSSRELQVPLTAGHHTLELIAFVATETAGVSQLEVHLPGDVPSSPWRVVQTGTSDCMADTAPQPACSVADPSLPPPNPFLPTPSWPAAPDNTRISCLHQPSAGQQCMHGRLEVKTANQQWGTVCGEGYWNNDQAADLACRAQGQGYTGGSIYTFGATVSTLWTGSPAGSGSVSVPPLDIVVGHRTCTGAGAGAGAQTELNLFQCPETADYDPTDPLQGCSHALDQGVICYASTSPGAQVTANTFVPCDAPTGAPACPSPAEAIDQCSGALLTSSSQPIVFSCIDFWTTPCSVSANPPTSYNDALAAFARCAEGTTTVAPSDTYASPVGIWNSRSGYCHASLDSGKYLSNQVVCGQGSNVAIGFHIRVPFRVNEGGPYEFRMHADYSPGSFMGVDGDMKSLSTWGYVQTGVVMLAVGDHEFEVVGFEDCCDTHSELEVHLPCDQTTDPWRVVQTGVTSCLTCTATTTVAACMAQTDNTGNCIVSAIGAPPQCTSPPPPPPPTPTSPNTHASPDARLACAHGSASGASSCRQGRMEVRNPTTGTWGTVCGMGFNDQGDAAATVFCKQLGYIAGQLYTFGASSLLPTMSAAAGYRTCSGSESTLFDCARAAGLSPADPTCLNGCDIECSTHSFDLGAICFDDDTQPQVNPGLAPCTTNSQTPPEPSQSVLFGCIDYSTSRCERPVSSALFHPQPNYSVSLAAFAACQEVVPEPRGYCHGIVADGDALRNQDICSNGATDTIGFHMRIPFRVIVPGQYIFRLTSDQEARFIGVDGNEHESTSPGRDQIVSVQLSVGEHEFEALGFAATETSQQSQLEVQLPCPGGSTFRKVQAGANNCMSCTSSPSSPCSASASCQTGDQPHVNGGTWSPAPVTGWSVGASATLVCGSGIPSPVGNAFITCLPTGLWSPATAIQCAQPTVPPNCILGLPQVANGNWTRSSNVFLGYQVGDVTTLNCDPGYVAFPTNVALTCMNTGQWSVPLAGTPIRCQTQTQPQGTCADPAAVTGGTWDPTPAGGWATGARASLTCGANYLETPSNAGLSCTSFGMWTGDIGATCQIATISTSCQEPTSIQGGAWSPPPQGGNYDDSTQTRLTCGSGMVSNPPNAMLVCSQGTWIGSGFGATCMPAPPPPPPGSGCAAPGVQHPVVGGQWAVQTSYLLHDSVRLVCDSGRLETPRNASVVCNPMGIWTGDVDATCTAAPTPPATVCAAPAGVTSGQWTPAPVGGFTQGTTAQLTCGAGLTATCTNVFNTGPCEPIMCGGDGQWIGPLGDCRGNTQPSSGCAPPAGVVGGTWSNPPGGTPAAFFANSQTSTLTCDADKVESPPAAALICSSNNWVDATPVASGGAAMDANGNVVATCEAAVCTTPTAVPNGVWSSALFGLYQAPQTITLTCGDGYTESPPAASLTCSDAGQWTGPGIGATCTVSPPPPGSPVCKAQRPAERPLDWYAIRALQQL